MNYLKRFAFKRGEFYKLRNGAIARIDQVVDDLQALRPAEASNTMEGSLLSRWYATDGRTYAGKDTPWDIVERFDGQVHIPVEVPREVVEARRKEIP